MPSLLARHKVATSIASGIALLGGLELWRQHRRESMGFRNYDSSPIVQLDSVTIAKTLPLRALSRVWGGIARLEVPVTLRRYLWYWLDRALECHLDEYGVEFEEYACLQDVFSRRLPYPPSVAHNTWLVSPVDAVVQAIGPLDDNLFQIKSHHYAVEELLGSSLPSLSPDQQWYYTILYLRPGGYHHFHSPADWLVTRQLHITGTLCPVSSVAQAVFPHAMVTNERVALLGSTHHGPIAMTAIAAYNVGDIAMDHDPLLQTNTESAALNAIYEKLISIDKKRGEHVGHFNFGSSVCLLFAGPKDLSLEVREGQNIRVGDAIAFNR